MPGSRSVRAYPGQTADDAVIFKASSELLGFESVEPQDLADEYVDMLGKLVALLVLDLGRELDPSTPRGVLKVLDPSEQVVARYIEHVVCMPEEPVAMRFLRVLDPNVLLHFRSPLCRSVFTIEQHMCFEVSDMSLLHLSEDLPQDLSIDVSSGLPRISLRVPAPIAFLLMWKQWNVFAVPCGAAVWGLTRFCNSHLLGVLPRDAGQRRRRHRRQPPAPRFQVQHQHTQWARLPMHCAVHWHPDKLMT